MLRSDSDIEIIADGGRRHRWSAAEKLRCVLRGLRVRLGFAVGSGLILALMLCTGSMTGEAGMSLKLHCAVSGNIAAAPKGFGRRLCRQVADGLGAVLVGSGELKQDVEMKRADVTLANLKVAILSSVEVEYVFSMETARDWRRRREQSLGPVRVSISDRELSDPVIQQIIQDLKRFMMAR